jgi:hypothetical protein
LEEDDIFIEDDIFNNDSITSRNSASINSRFPPLDELYITPMCGLLKILELSKYKHDVNVHAYTTMPLQLRVC